MPEVVKKPQAFGPPAMIKLKANYLGSGKRSHFYFNNPWDINSCSGNYYALASRGGGGTPIYGLYRYVPRDRVCFLRFSDLK